MVLGIPASEIKVRADELYEGAGTCVFDGGAAGKTISFTITVAKTVQDAADEMVTYRSHLETAAGTSQYKDKLPNGAYSEIEGLADDAVWTDINKTLNVRQGNVSLQISLPNDKMTQLKIAQKFISKL